MTVDSPNVAVAFALVCGAGAATALGAAVVFVPSLVKLASKRVLAAGLGLSAGVMTYVSFVEIFQKSYKAFLSAGYEEGHAYTLATGTFFCGVIFMVGLNTLVTWLLGNRHSHNHEHPADQRQATFNRRTSSVSREDDDEQRQQIKDSEQHKQQAVVANEDAQIIMNCPCCSADPAADLERFQHMAEEIEDFQQKEHHDWDPHAHKHGPDCIHATTDGIIDANMSEKGSNRSSSEGDNDTEEGRKETQSEEAHATDIDHEGLMRMSVNTALAIAIHNFPEGLATFVAALSDTKVGVVLAVAIAIHNIPEGLCVALPIYYATGRKWRAFTWACLSGASEPFAALLGWAVLANSFNDTIYGSLFGLVAGMMVIISTRELLPTAHRYDPEDTVVTFSFMLGMFIMALSLVLFLI